MALDQVEHAAKDAASRRPATPDARQPAATAVQSAGEGEMDDAAGRHRLDGVVLLQRLQTVPQPDTAAEQDRDLHDVQVVDEAGGQEVADHGRAPADADVGAGGRYRATARASAGPASRKWNVVPPSISIGGRGRWVNT